ncbi:hypothetical protein GOODEAATRI_029635 [Goodea atripinnis]|uniref:Uncharacterized protein n=1 Tax=Goodea atripinnis TaxID=208336 RepID=A0ABV0P8V9_9TELE
MFGTSSGFPASFLCPALCNSFTFPLIFLSSHSGSHFLFRLASLLQQLQQPLWETCYYSKPIILYQTHTHKDQGINTYIHVADVPENSRSEEKAKYKQANGKNKPFFFKILHSICRTPQNLCKMKHFCIH